MAFQMRQSKFRHVFGKPLRKDLGYDGIRLTKIAFDSRYCAVNKKYIAVLTDAAKNSDFLVLLHSKTGRLSFGDLPLVTGHKGAVLDIAWDPFDDNVIASASEDNSVKVWLIPEGGLKTNLEEPVVSLEAHSKRVGIVQWHPVAKNILLSAGYDYSLFLWNVGTGEALVQIDCHPDVIYSVDFNWQGSEIVTACKDKKLRVISSRSGEVLREGKGHEGSKPTQVKFIKSGDVFTTGFSRRSERQYALWRKSDFSNILNEEIDSSNGVLFPIYDPDLEIIYLVGKGDSLIRFYEVTSDAPFVHFLNMYQSTTPQRGFGFMPKRGCDVNANEILRLYKMQNTGLLEVIPFVVPRKSEQFQSDIFPDTRAETPALTAEEWFDQEKDSDPLLQTMTDLYKGDVKVGTKVRVRPKSNILDARTSSPLGSPSLRRHSPPPVLKPLEEPASETVVMRVQLKSQTGTPIEKEVEAKDKPTPELFEEAVTENEPQPVIKPEAKQEEQSKKPIIAEKKPQVVKQEQLPKSQDTVSLEVVEGLVEDVKKLRKTVNAHERRIKALEERLAQHENDLNSD